MQTVPSVEQQCALAVLTFMPLSESSDTAKQSLRCICEVGVLHEIKSWFFSRLEGLACTEPGWYKHGW